MHLYLVDTNLQILLAQRTITLDQPFHEMLQKKVQEQLESPITPGAFVTTLQRVWQKHSSRDMSDKALIKQSVALNIPAPPVLN